MIFVSKSQPAPASLATEKLKSSGTYNQEDVVKRLAEDFHGKCYICEQNKPTSINIEHFYSHEGNIDLKFDWNNLFLVCAHCNNIKLNHFNNLLNCTDISDNAEMSIAHFIKPFPKEKANFEIRISSVKAEQTKELLEKSFNGDHTPQKTLESSHLRDLLLKEIKVFQDLLIEYFECNKDGSYLIKIKEHLSSRSAFTAFKRWIIRENSVLNQEFGEYIG